MNELKTNELMDAVEVEEVVETPATNGRKSKAIGVAIGLAVTLGGVALYKKVIKPRIAARKARKEAEKMAAYQAADTVEVEVE